MPGWSGQTRRWAGPWLAAAVVLLLVGGLGVLIGRRPESPASASGDHVLPTSMLVPATQPAGGPGRALPLMSITSGADTDVLEYASDALNVNIRVDRTAVGVFEGEAVEVRNGQTATLEGDDDGGRLMWNAPNGPTVTIAWIGAVSGGVDSITAVVDGLILVDEATWEAATEFGGFIVDHEMMRRRVGPIDVSLEGDLQSGLLFRVGNLGFTALGLELNQCEVRSNFDNEIWFVLSRFRSGTATVTWPDGVVAHTELTAIVPGSDFGVGAVERSRRDVYTEPTVVCEEES